MSEAYNLIPEIDYLDTCEAIREKAGTTDLIKSGEMARKIRSIPSPKPEQTYIKEYTANGNYPIDPEKGKVIIGGSIKVDVTAEDPKLQAKTITPTKQTQTATPDAGFDGLSKAIVDPIPAKYPDVSGDTVTADSLLEGRTAHDNTGAQINGTAKPEKPEQEYVKEYTANGDYPITPDSGKVIAGGSIKVKVSSTGGGFPNGTEWTQSNIIDGEFYFVANANGIWVAVPDAGLLYSTDGKTWAQSNIIDGEFYFVANANGIWVAVPDVGLLYSTDGKTWAQSNIIVGVLYGL